MTKLLRLGGLVLLLGLCACSSKPKEPDMTKVCPGRLVQTVLANQRAMEDVKPGVTTLGDLRTKGMGLPVRTVKLTHYGEPDLAMALFPTGVPNCPFMLPGMTYTPVVTTKGGVVMAYGMPAMEDLHGKGWVIEGAKWPWQDYNYGYIPFN